MQTETYKAVIAIAAIRPPANGRGKSYSVDTEDGNTFSIWPDKNKLGLLRVGEQYEVEINDKEAESGHVFHNIVGTPRHLGPYRTVKQPATKPGGTQKMDQHYWKPKDPAEQRQIWICALLAREIEVRGLMSKEELSERVRIHAEVWDQWFGAVQLVPEGFEVYGQPTIARE